MRTLGSDPEVFLINNAERPVIATGYVGGSKKKPIKVRFGGLQEDNVAAEFNIDPAATEDEWVRNHQEVMAQLAARVAKKGLRISIRNAMEFNRSELEADPKAMEFGCDPSFDAWVNGAAIEPPDPNSSIRTCGGHIHIGDPRLVDPEQAMHAVRLLSVLVLPYIREAAPDDHRAFGYGTAGAFRMKPYGVEWRAPSNVWLRSENAMRWVYRSVNAVLDSKAMNNHAIFHGRYYWHALNLSRATSYTLDTEMKGSMAQFQKTAGVKIGAMPV